LFKRKLKIVICDEFSLSFLTATFPEVSRFYWSWGW